MCVDLRQLTAFALPPIHYGAGGCYHVEARYAKRSKRHHIRLNSERDVLPPVEPLPAPKPPGLHSFARIVHEIMSGTVQWVRREEVERLHRLAIAEVERSVIGRRAPTKRRAMITRSRSKLPADQSWNRRGLSNTADFDARTDVDAVPTMCRK